MTRLVTDDICWIADTLPAYDRQLQDKTGHNLRQLALRAAGYNHPTEAIRLDAAPTIVVPVTSGQGIIGGFSEVVAAILSHVGFAASVSSRPDVGGLTDAYEKGARMVLLSDDHCFSAINMVTRQVADNSAATGRGFAAALELMAGALSQRRVLVLGCGPVGKSAARFLVAAGAHVGLLDTDIDKSRALADHLKKTPAAVVWIEDQMDRAMPGYNLVLDATPVADVVTPAHVTERTMMAAPGVPCGLPAHMMDQLASRLIHDPLQIGVAVMAMEAWLQTREAAS